MVRGQYIAGTGMLLQRRMMETITNNITNADTTGYKKENLVAHSFDAVMLERINDTGNPARPPAVGPLNFGTQIDQVYIDYTMGSLEETGRSTDMALVGDVFFVLDTPNGERYTRAGAFLVDREGYHIDGEGNYLLGSNGRIYAGGDEFTVDSAGN
ncbi:MAG: flagellar hook-basal body complex protein, partial [Oscillospiraceae bacterium]|nr:flagellar hook-basal body complex protein [Oscillospiraceae bacterium]